MDLHLFGVKAWYADGTIRKALVADIATQVPLWPTTGVLVAAAYFQEQYTEFVDGVPRTSRYRFDLCSTRAGEVSCDPRDPTLLCTVTRFDRPSCDVYYTKVTPTLIQVGAGLVTDVPTGATGLLGILVPDDTFYTVYNAFYQDPSW